MLFTMLNFTIMFIYCSIVLFSTKTPITQTSRMSAARKFSNNLHARTIRTVPDACD